MEVKPHTSLKHRILGVYFLICRQVMKKRKLYYVDLYAGDGECICEEAPIQKWDTPTFRSILGNAEKEGLKVDCSLNELDSENFKKIMKKAAAYPTFVKRTTNIDANLVYGWLLEQIPKDEWSIFFLDPFKHSDLDWKTIEGISKHEGYDTFNHCGRKPELIINLMTLTMQRTMAADPDAITRALGTDDWKGKVESKNGEKVHEIFSDIFLQKLEDLGYSTISFQISQTLPFENVLYYLIFASSVPAANEILKTKFKPYVDNMMKEKWVKENFQSRMITRAKKKGNRLLTDYGGV